MTAPAAFIELPAATTTPSNCDPCLTLSLQRQEDAKAFIAGLTGAQEYIADFLQDEVLGGQPQALQEFLLRTSILDQLCGPLCDALTGRGDGRETLEELAERNLFLLHLDDVRRWYRYHH